MRLGNTRHERFTSYKKKKTSILFLTSQELFAKFDECYLSLSLILTKSIIKSNKKQENEQNEKTHLF